MGMNDPQPDKSLRDYYAQRAAEYEQIYYRDDPKRQLEQLQLAAAIAEATLGRDVLEIACGTGYWKQFADRTARSVTALDANSEVLDIARQKALKHTHWQTGDAYAPPSGSYTAGLYTAGLACCWISHVPRARLSEWLRAFHAALQPGARVLLADNVYVEGVGGDLSGPDAAGDTYKTRPLAGGGTQQVLKNYFSDAELRDLLAPYASDLHITQGQCFWWASYTVKP